MWYLSYFSLCTCRTCFDPAAFSTFPPIPSNSPPLWTVFLPTIISPSKTFPSKRIFHPAFCSLLKQYFSLTTTHTHTRSIPAASFTPTYTVPTYITLRIPHSWARLAIFGRQRGGVDGLWGVWGKGGKGREGVSAGMIGKEVGMLGIGEVGK